MKNNFLKRHAGYLGLVATLCFALGCSAVSQSDRATRGEPVIVVEKRTAGMLPQAFTVRVYASRLVIYEGVRNVRLTGQHRYYLSDEQYKRLLQAFDNFGFMQWQSSYASYVSTPATISLQKEGAARTILFPISREYFVLMSSVEEQLHTAKLRCPAFVLRNDKNVDACKLESEVAAEFLKGKEQAEFQDGYLYTARRGT